MGKHKRGKVKTVKVVEDRTCQISVETKAGHKFAMFGQPYDVCTFFEAWLNFTDPDEEADKPNRTGFSTK